MFPAAARLILLPDIKKPATGIKLAKSQPAQPALSKLKTSIKELIKSPKASQSQIIRLLVDNLHDELRFSKAVMVLYSPNRDSLSTYLSKGLVQGSPFHSLQFEVVHSGLFKSLLSKPQALWVNYANYKNLSPLLPKNLKEACYSEIFFLIPLFIGKQSIGFVYCDPSNAINKLDGPGYWGGVFSPVMDNPTHHFHQWVARKLATTIKNIAKSGQN